MERLVKVEKGMVGDHFKKVCKVTVDVALAKLETSNQERAARLETIIYNAQSKMDSTIYKHGLLSKQQRETITSKVGELNERLFNHELVLARMESGLKKWKN